MSDIKTKRISELPESTTLSGFYTIGAKLVSGAWNSIRVNLGFVQTAADNATAGATAANAAASSASTATADLRTLEATVKQSEAGRVSAETSRVTAETSRASAEEARAAAEETRVTNEEERKTAETARAEAEATRKEQEEEREAASAEAVTNAQAAADRLNNLSDHRDEIRDGYWWRWDEETEEWYNTGEIAKGNVMYATFEVDEQTATLSMYTDEEYKGATISLEEETGLLTLLL